MLPPVLSAQTWRELPSLPDPEGFAGAFGGVSGGALLVAGGTNFPDKRPWEGGTKVWYDDIYALEQPRGVWKKVGKLPKPNGYGVSITVPEGVICVGGGDAGANFKEVFRLSYQTGSIEVEALPSLPKPCAFMTGVLLGNAIYIAGGLAAPDATEALNTFWKLDLTDLAKGWQSLESWPGVGRILATLGCDGKALFLCGGAGLHAGPEGKAEREWLKELLVYHEGKGWSRKAPLPRVSVAAPSPAVWRDGKLLILGGDDGELVLFEPKEKHPGFPRSVLVYDPNQDAWNTEGTLPFSLVTSPLVMWHGQMVVPGGEARPGKRSPAVWWTGD